MTKTNATLLRKAAQRLPEKDIDGGRLLLDAANEIVRLRAALTDARCDVQDALERESKKHRIESYRQQLAEIDALLEGGT